jgi:hypothetical protein
MANDEDLARLRQGVAVWNDWREQNRKRRVDLSDIDLWRAPRSFIQLLTSAKGRFSAGPPRGEPPRGEPRLGLRQDEPQRGEVARPYGA